MGKAKNGDTVKVHYTGKLKNGEVFDTSKEREPLEFTVGSGNIMPGVEQGVVGMDVGDTKTLEIQPEQAFGLRREELVVEVSKADLPNHITPQVGQQLQMRQPEGKPIHLIVTEMNEDSVTLDANHPLAGHALFFDLELVEIV